jgi:hypothetical protein
MRRRISLFGETYLDVSDACRVRVEWEAEIDVYGRRDECGPGAETWSLKWRAVLEDLTSDGTINLDDDAMRAFGLDVRAREAVNAAIDRATQDEMEGV